MIRHMPGDLAAGYRRFRLGRYVEEEARYRELAGQVQRRRRRRGAGAGAGTRARSGEAVKGSGEGVKVIR